MEDGSQFDSSRDRGTKFSFNLGKGEVIKGWDVGVASMNKGELAVFTIKSDYGYGDVGSPPKIPGGATLIFEVELFDFEGEDLTKLKDRGVTRRVVNPGEGLDHPNEGSLIEAHIKAEVKGKVVDERDVKFCLGEGLEIDLPNGVEVALEKMKKQEKSRISIASNYGFGAAGNIKLGIPSLADLVYEVNTTFVLISTKFSKDFSFAD